MSDFTEKDRRIYYQNIVYVVRSVLGEHLGNGVGGGLVCGTVESPSTDVQDCLSRTLNIGTQKPIPNKPSKECLCVNCSNRNCGGFAPKVFVVDCAGFMQP